MCQPQNNPKMKRNQIKRELRHPRPTKRVLRRELGWGLVNVGDGSEENVVDDECDEVEDDENDGSLELVGDPLVPRHDTSHPSASTPLRGSKKHPGPALRKVIVMQEDPKKDDLCPGRPRAKRMPRVTLRPASRKDPVEGVPDGPAPVILKPAVQKGHAERAPEAPQLIEDSPPEVPHSVEGEQEVPGPVEREGDGPGQVQHALEVPGLGEQEPDALPVKPKRYRRVRVRKVMKKDPNLAEDREIQQLHARQASTGLSGWLTFARCRRNDKRRCSRAHHRLQRWTQKQFNVKSSGKGRKRWHAAGGFSPMRSGKQKRERERKKKKGERGPGEQKKAWIEKAIARRRRQEQRGEEREAILRSEGARSSRALTEEEWLKMQPMAQPVKPKRYRRVRVRKVMKKDPNLAEDREIQQLHARQASTGLSGWLTFARCRRNDKRRCSRARHRLQRWTQKQFNVKSSGKGRKRWHAAGGFSPMRSGKQKSEREREREKKKEKEDQANKRKPGSKKQ